MQSHTGTEILSQWWHFPVQPENFVKPEYFVNMTTFLFQCIITSEAVKCNFDVSGAASDEDFVDITYLHLSVWSFNSQWSKSSNPEGYG